LRSLSEKQTMPTISVIIPSYNCEAYIAGTIESVLKQTFKDIELIVVDDGSTDRTQEIVTSYGRPVRLVTQENAGVCAARNRGIAEAKGQFICLMDHDDYWFPWKLERQFRELQAQPAVGMVYSGFIRWYASADGVFPDPTSFDLTVYPDDIDPDFSGWIYHQFLLDCPVLTSTTLFRAEVFQTCGTFDQSLPYSEDWELFLRVSREYPFLKLRRPTTLYRQHPLQGSRMVRDIDYRTVLLAGAAEKWGLCSRDGRRVSREQFNHNIARYHAEFALGHVRGGKLNTAIRSLLKAWRAHPTRLKYLAYIPAALLGWKPSW